jgi:hypothetical protein
MMAVSWGNGGWACQDLNLGPHPYQGSARCQRRRLVSAGSQLRPAQRCTAGDRCEPLGSDGVWTKRGPGMPRLWGQRRSASRTLASKGDPRRLPPTSEPRLDDRLVRGSPGGVWARDIPLYRRAIPGHRHGGSQHPACSNHAHVEDDVARVHAGLAEQGGSLAAQAREHAKRARGFAAKEPAEAERLRMVGPAEDCWPERAD